MPASAVPVAIVLTLLVAVRSEALDPFRAISQYRHDAWLTEQGLPQNSVNTIIQTKDGYIWMGTYQGLVRFDGIRFTTFHPGNARGLTSNRIVALHEDRDGVLWIGTNAGGLARYKDGQFKTFTTEHGLPSDSVLAIHEDNHGVLWIGTRGGGVCRLINGEFVRLEADGLTGAVIPAIAETSDGALWFGTDGSGLLRYKDDAFQRFTTSNGLGDDEVWSLLADDRGALWIGTYGGGVTRLHNGQFTTFTTKDGLADDTVFSMIADRDGNVWLGTNAGLTRFNEGRFSSFSTGDGLSGESVYALFEDAERNLWVGTFTGGLNRFKDGSVTAYTSREGLTDEFVYPVIEDHNGWLWFGTTSGALIRGKDGKFETLPWRATVPIWSLIEDREGRLWIGTGGKGLVCYTGGRFITYTAKDGLANDTIWSLANGHDGSLWVGTSGGGLTRLKDGRFDTYDARHGLANGFVKVMLEDHLGRLWIGTDGGGLFCLQDGKFSAYTTRHGLSNDSVRALHEDVDGVLWIGTYGGGVSRLQGDQFTRFGTAQGLYDDVVLQILEDGQSNLWMTTNRGVFRVSRRELNDLANGRASNVTVLSYGKTDGMVSMECSDGSPAGFTARDGRMWIPTSRGVAVIDPLRLRPNRRPPPVIIEHVTADSKAISAGQTVAPGEGTGRIEFRYVGLSYSAPERVRFRYRLEGFDKGWVDAGPRHTASYTNLPPGRHRFIVQACNDSGVWNEAGASFVFHRAPRFIETYWFYAFCGFSLLSVGAAGHFLRVRRAARREQVLLQIVDDRTSQLAEANQRLEKLSFLDDLTGLANRRRFDECLDLEWRRAYRGGAPLSIVMIDIDYFKAFNDAYGHQKGDLCLQRVGAALGGVVSRAGDVVARYGGEEFVMLLQGTNREGAATIAELLRAAVIALEIPHAHSPAAPVVTVSIGVATVTPVSEATAVSAMADADRALYRAKHSGRNRWEAADSIAVSV